MGLRSSRVQSRLGCVAHLLPRHARLVSRSWRCVLQVSKTKDRDFILKRVDSAGGLQTVTEEVVAALRQWLLDEGKRICNNYEAQASVDDGAWQIFGQVGRLFQDHGQMDKAEQLLERGPRKLLRSRVL